jgi:hypothetical protein
MSVMASIALTPRLYIHPAICPAACRGRPAPEATFRNSSSVFPYSLSFIPMGKGNESRAQTQTCLQFAEAHNHPFFHVFSPILAFLEKLLLHLQTVATLPKQSN